MAFERGSSSRSSRTRVAVSERTVGDAFVVAQAAGTTCGDRIIGRREPHVTLKDRDAAALREFVGRVRAALGEQVLALKLFGSKATGRDTPESDIDILVLVDEASIALEDEILGIAFDVNLAHDVYISSRVIGKATIADPVWANTPFVRAAVRDGIPL